MLADTARRVTRGLRFLPRREVLRNKVLGLRTIDSHVGDAQGRSDAHYGLAAALFALAWLVLSWPWLSGAVTIPWDAKAHWLPHIQFLAASLARGESVFWAPQVFAGSPEIADPQSAVFSLPFVLLALIDKAPGFIALDATVLAMAGLGGLAVLSLFRDRGWHWAAGLVAALGFAFGGSMAWRVQHIGQVLSLAFLAIAFWLLERALVRRSVLWGTACGLAAGLMLLGRDQVALLGAYALAARVLWSWIASRARGGGVAGVAPALAAGFSGLLVSAWPVWLASHLAAQSNRPAIDLGGAGAGSLHPALLLTAFAPDLFAASGPMADYWGPPSFTWSDTGLFLAQNMGVLYLGALPLSMLLGPGLWRGWIWAPTIRGVTLGLAVFLAYALGWYTPLFAQAYAFLPGIDLFRRPADATFLVGGAVAVIGGYLLHRHLNEPQVLAMPLPRWLAAGIPALIVAAAIGVAFSRGHVAEAIRPVIQGIVTFAAGFAVLTFAGRLKQTRPVLAGALIVAFMIADLAYHNRPNGSTGLPPSAYEVLSKQSGNETLILIKDRIQATEGSARRDRVEIAGLGFAWQNAALVHDFEQTLGYNPVRLRDYALAVAPEDAIAVPEQRRFTPLMPSYRSLMADLLGLRWIVTGVPVEEIDRKLAPGDLVAVARTADGFVYENPRALPRVLFAGLAIYDDFSTLLRTGAWPDFDPGNTVLLDSGAEAKDADVALAQGGGRVSIRAYGQARVVLAVEAEQAGYVVLNDAWHPWWTVTVDGAPSPLLKANVLFRAVKVPPGRHEVVFAFRPIEATAEAAAAAVRAVLELRSPLH